MRFQVLDSTVALADSWRWLKFRIVPCGHGEISISDGSRVAAVDLQERWGQQLTLADLQGEITQGTTEDAPHDFVRSIPIELHVADKKFDGYRTFSKKDGWKKLLANDDGICGFAKYVTSDGLTERRHCVEIALFASAEIFEEIYQIQKLPPAPTFFKIDIEGLEETMFSDMLSPWVSAKWDLSNETFSGQGNLRPVYGFHFERHVMHFAP